MSLQRDIQRERLFFLEFLALFTGQVTRKDLVSRFGISEPAATKDLSLYAELAPGLLNYDLRRKCYVYGDGKPLFTHLVDQALFSLTGDRPLATDPEHAKRLSSWVSTSIKRKIPVSLVAVITRCIYQHRKITANYVSISSGDKKRELSPLAVVYDGLRWHIRCFDHKKEEFRDYNLARFSEVEQSDPSDITLEKDQKWNTEVQLKLVPHPKSNHPETIRLDYDITDDAKYVSLRACLVGYFLRHWPIDYSDEGTENPNARHLFLKNKAELIRQGVPEWTFSPG